MSRPAWVDPALYPFTDHWVEVDGSTVHYLDEGSGPPLLLLHSNPTWSFLYRGVVAALRDDFRCIAVDYPGYGLSTAAEGYGFTLREHSAVVGRLIEHLDLRDATLVGHDWGGPIGVHAMAAARERFRGLVLGNTKLWADRSIAARGFSGALSGRLGRHLIAQRNVYVERLLPAAFKSRPLGAAEHAHYRGPFPTPESRTPIWVSPRELRTGRDFLDEVEAALPAVSDLPLLLLWAAKDPATRARERRRIEATFPDHRTVPLPGVGHYLWDEAPELTAAAIRDFAR